MVRNKTYTDIVTGIDIGSSTVRVVVGQLTVSKEGGSHLQIIATVEQQAEGIQKGQIVSIEDTVSAVSGVLEQAEKIVGVPIEHVWVGVSGTQVIEQESKGVIAVSRTDGEISEEDLDRAIEAAKAVATPLNYEILHVLPRSFTVDGQTGIKDPIGMTGIRLEVDTKIMHSVSSHIKNVSKVVYRAGVDIDDFVLSILAAGEVVTNSRQKELGCVVINIGGPTTSMVVYEDGEVIHTSTIPIGSSHITNDLALGLKTSIDIAEHVKINHGVCISKNVSKKDVIDLKDLGAPESEIISKYYIAQIIEARVSEILEKIDEELTKIERSRMLPAGAIFVGAGSKIDGLISLSKQEISLPSQLGYPLNIDSISDKIHDIGFVATVGLVRWGSHLAHVGKRRSLPFNMVTKVGDRVRGIFKNLVP